MLSIAAPDNVDRDLIAGRENAHGFLLVSDRKDKSVDLATILKVAGTVTQLTPSDLKNDTGEYFRVIIDVDLRDTATAVRLRKALEKSSMRATPRYFVTAKDHHTDTQASALQAFATLSRPFKAEQLLRQIRLDCSDSFHELLKGENDQVCAGVAAAHTVLVQVFEGLNAGQPLALNDVLSKEEHITNALHASGLQPWLQVVNCHHNSSYRHCLSVTGFAVAFAQHLGFSVRDQRRLARSALLHDVGKAYTPLSILDKPGKLTDPEMQQMRQHARVGYDALRAQGGFSKETLDVVLHHHELLDGTGYPDQLRAEQISDIVRMVTIVDIYSALVEERSYRAGMTPADAYAILLVMGPKLDEHLVAAFRPIALGTQ